MCIRIICTIIIKIIIIKSNTYPAGLNITVFIKIILGTIYLLHTICIIGSICILIPFAFLIFIPSNRQLKCLCRIILKRIPYCWIYCCCRSRCSVCSTIRDGFGICIINFSLNLGWFLNIPAADPVDNRNQNSSYNKHDDKNHSNDTCAQPHHLASSYLLLFFAYSLTQYFFVHDFHLLYFISDGNCSVPSQLPLMLLFMVLQ